MGGGFGIQFTMFETIRASGESTFAIDADMGVRFITGGRAEYLTEGSIARENGDLIYDVLESATSLLNARFGICFRF